MEPISFKQAKAQGISAPSTAVKSSYSFSVLKKRDLMDSVIDGFDSNAAAKMLGELTGGRDPFCGKQILEIGEDGEWKIIDGVAVQWDHLIAVNFLGLTTDGNMCPICTSCNSAKSGASLFEFQKSLLNQKRSYLTAKAFRRFHKAFSSSYRGNFPELYSIARSLAKKEAEESEIRSHIGFFLDYSVIRNGQQTKALRISSRENFWETSPSREHFEELREIYSSTDGTQGQRSALGVVQRIVDEQFLAGKIIEASPTSSLEVFANVAELAYGYDANRDESEDSNTIKTAMTKTKAVLIALAKRSENVELVDYAVRLPGYASYMAKGFVLIGMGEEDRRLMNSLAELATEKTVASRISSNGALYHLIADRMVDRGISSLRDFPLSEFRQISQSYISENDSKQTVKMKEKALNICSSIFRA